MKKLFFAFLLLSVILVSCHKKYESKTGTYTGTEIYFKGSYDQQDTFDYSISAAIFTLIYDRSTKEYTVSGNTGHFPVIDFEREDFKDDHVQHTGIWNNLTNWNVDLEGNHLSVHFDKLYLDDYIVIGFEGDKN